MYATRDLVDLQEEQEAFEEDEKTVQMGSLLPKLVSLENDVRQLERRVQVMQEIYEKRIAILLEERDEYDKRRRQAMDKVEHYRTIAQSLKDEVLKLAKEEK
jgi:hypothetical protein